MSHKFPWGKVTEVHTIGPHEITEYVVGPEWVNAGDTEFLCRHGGTWDTLDQALIASVCHAVHGMDDNLPGYVCRLIGIEVN